MLDVGINKPFNNYIRNNVAEWQVAHDFNDKPLRQDVAHWIWTSWLAIKDITIKNTWKHIGFNAKGSKDGVINIRSDTAERVVESDMGSVGSVNDEEQLDPLAYNT